LARSTRLVASVRDWLMRCNVWYSSLAIGSSWSFLGISHLQLLFISLIGSSTKLLPDALEALSSGESIIFVQEPFGLFRHKDADFFALEGEGDP
jgi:hypothetical protein